MADNDTPQNETPSDSGKPLGEPGLKALQSERERAANLQNALSAATAKREKLEAAQLSELERAQQAASEAKAQAETARTEALRYRIAAEHGIDATDAELFLTGGDNETMSRQALRLLERTPTTPRPDPSQGASGADLALNGDPLLQALKQKLNIP